jgi:hypothetical protein
MILNYFGGRIFDLKIHEEISNVEPSKNASIIFSKDEVVIFKTNTKQLRIIFGYIPELSKILKSMPYHSWDAKNKWWTIPYTERLLEELKQHISTLKLRLRYEEQAPHNDRVSRI